jgi:prepilin-type N-terminal cleavage/methylation domain-containing protein
MSPRLFRRGFSLLEMLVSLALLGILMVTLNTFLFSMSELWGGGRDQRLFDQHARAATSLVRRAFAEATLGPGASGVALKDVDNGAGTTEPRLGFLLADAGRLADWPEAPLPDVDFTVFVLEEGRGLVFQWQSRLELERDLTDKHETVVISPFVTGLKFETDHDPELKEWTVEDVAPRRSRPAPRGANPRAYTSSSNAARSRPPRSSTSIKRSGATTP